MGNYIQKFTRYAESPKRTFSTEQDGRNPAGPRGLYCILDVHILATFRGCTPLGTQSTSSPIAQN